MNIFIAGDSTAAEKTADKRPETGWGEMIHEFFDDRVVIRNFALNGRSSKSFVDEDHLDRILSEIGAGDFLFVQFAHNDEKDDPERHTDAATTYRESLRRYALSARERGAFPVFLSPVTRRSFGADGRIVPTHGDYPDSMCSVAGELSAPFLDLHSLSIAAVNALGPEGSKQVYLWAERGLSVNYPGGVEDNTHFSAHGARMIASLVAEAIRDTIPAIEKYLRK